MIERVLELDAERSRVDARAGDGDGTDPVLILHAEAATELEPMSIVFVERRATAANGKITGVTERPYSVRLRRWAFAGRVYRNAPWITNPRWYVAEGKPLGPAVKSRRRLLG
jgi:hypothetical protein